MAFSFPAFTALRSLAGQIPDHGAKMPVLFVGHGSPMNGIDDNEFSRGWKQIAADIPVPRAVIVVSAHWLTRGTRITAMDFPKTIHDFGGFSRELYDVRYNAPGSPALARETASLFRSATVVPDHEWGLDHGAWTVVRQMYPEARIPVLQLSIDYTRNASYHYELARELTALRQKGVLILGSGNMVHNLGMIDIPSGRFEDFNLEHGFDWAIEMNEKFKQLILSGGHTALINYENLGKGAKLAIPTAEHYLPLMYTLGMQNKKDTIALFNDKVVGGAFSMTSVRVG